MQNPTSKTLKAIKIDIWNSYAQELKFNSHYSFEALFLVIITCE